MQTIIKSYSITNWANYSEVEGFADVASGTTEVLLTVMGGRNVTITTTLDDDGEGREIREFQVEH